MCFENKKNYGYYYYDLSFAKKNKIFFFKIFLPFFLGAHNILVIQLDDRMQS